LRAAAALAFGADDEELLVPEDGVEFAVAGALPALPGGDGLVDGHALVLLDPLLVGHAGVGDDLRHGRGLGGRLGGGVVGLRVPGAADALAAVLLAFVGAQRVGGFLGVPVAGLGLLPAGAGPADEAGVLVDAAGGPLDFPPGHGGPGGGCGARLGAGELAVLALGEDLPVAAALGAALVGGAEDGGVLAGADDVLVVGEPGDDAEGHPGSDAGVEGAAAGDFDAAGLGVGAAGGCGGAAARGGPLPGGRRLRGHDQNSSGG